MKIIEMNDGQKVQYKLKGTVVSFADGELAIDCARYQRDWGVHLNVCANADNNLVIGTESGLNYVAQLEIPEREYVYPETPDPAPADPDADETDDGMDGEMRGETEPPTPIPLDMEKVTLSLWATGM